MYVNSLWFIFNIVNCLKNCCCCCFKECSVFLHKLKMKYKSFFSYPYRHYVFRQRKSTENHKTYCKNKVCERLLRYLPFKQNSIQWPITRKQTWSTPIKLHLQCSHSMILHISDKFFSTFVSQPIIISTRNCSKRI
jgi:hypothetical protein